MPGLRYLGRGEFIPGVPARDLTADEAAQFRAVVDEHRRNTGRELYRPSIPAPETAGAVARAEPAVSGDANPGATGAAAKPARQRGSGATSEADTPTEADASVEAGDE
jgi:hypothetical protein